MNTITEIFARAFACHQKSDFAQAEALYWQLLQKNPCHADTYHMLGVLAQQTGDRDKAVSLIRRAIGLQPNAAAYHFNLGILLKSKGQPAEAVSCYREAVRQDPQFLEALVNLGCELRGVGEMADAAQVYRQASGVQPGNAGLHNNLGVTLKDLGQLAEATECLQQALRINPQYADALDNLSVVLRQQGKLAEAEECCRQALRINPAHAQAYNNLGVVLQDLGKSAEAVECFRHATQLDPQNAGVHYNLGTALLNHCQLPEAIDCYRQALRLQPENPKIYVNLGNALNLQGNIAEATECFRQALRINPNQTEVIHNLGSALVAQGLFFEGAECFRQALKSNPNYCNAHCDLGKFLVWNGQFAEAVNCYRRALEIDPNHQSTLLSRSFLRLLQGDFENGWPDFELRWLWRGQATHFYSQPRWDGSPLEGKTVLIFAEGGLGDTIHFLRYLPFVKERGGTVLFQCQVPMTKLLAGIPGVDMLVPAGAPLPPFDVQIPLMSLPGLFVTTLSDIPATIPYLAADAALVSFWRGEVDSLPGFKVGIVWEGSNENKSDCRSVPLKYFEVLTRQDNVQLVSLQLGPGTGQLAGASFPIADLGSRFNPYSLDDLAAALMSIDLVVTVDTAVAHLAGALGVPVWTVLQMVPDWRWLLGRDDSPWYPTMRLFRQRKRGAWAEVFEQIAESLRQLLAA